MLLNRSRLRHLKKGERSLKRFGVKNKTRKWFGGGAREKAIFELWLQGRFDLRKWNWLNWLFVCRLIVLPRNCHTSESSGTWGDCWQKSPTSQPSVRSISSRFSWYFQEAPPVLWTSCALSHHRQMKRSPKTMRMRKRNRRRRQQPSKETN